MEVWSVKNHITHCTFTPDELGISEIEARILANRGFFDAKEAEEFLHPQDFQVPSPILMKDMIKAGNVLSGGIRNHHRIRIIGDYDVDGMCSTTILLRGLRPLGAEVDFAIGLRTKDGYGINERLVSEAYKDGVEILLTCDNGIVAFEAIEKAKELGLTVIVTDHHDPLEENGQTVLPLADAVINPKRSGDPYPCKHLCGAAVAYKLVTYLHTLFGFESMEEELLPYVAMATVCDVMPLLGENRWIVWRGLPLIDESSHLGLIALREVSGYKDKPMTVHGLGFGLGPRLNSVGRLEDASEGVRLLTTDSWEEANVLASHFQELNDTRKRMTDEAMRRFLSSNQEAGQGIFLYCDPAVHESLAGLLAGKIKELLYRPVIMLTKGEQGILKGSGRSIDGVHITEMMRHHESLLHAIGGHPKACGLSLPEENLNALRDALARETIEEHLLLRRVRLDAALSFTDITEGLIRRLERFAPFGEGNPQPLFGTKHCRVLGFRQMGKKGQFYRLLLEESGRRLTFVSFLNTEDFLEEITRKYGRDMSQSLRHGNSAPISVSVAYHLGLHTFRGETSIEAQIKYIQVE